MIGRLPPAVVAAALAWNALAQAPPSADRLVAAVLEARATTGFRARAKLTRSTGAGEDLTRQLLVIGRRDGTRTTTLYRLVSAKAPGRALLVDDDGSRRASATQFENGVAGPAALGAPFFDSDLRVEDVVESFWRWRARAVVGEERIDNRRCVIVEFRPAPDDASRYTRVRAWIAPDLALPLRVAAFDGGGLVEKQLTAERVARRDGRWVAARLLVEPSDGRSRTVLEGTKFEGNLTLPASEFTVAAVAASLRRTERVP